MAVDISLDMETVYQVGPYKIRDSDSLESYPAGSRHLETIPQANLVRTCQGRTEHGIEVYLKTWKDTEIDGEIMSDPTKPTTDKITACYVLKALLEGHEWHYRDGHRYVIGYGDVTGNRMLCIRAQRFVGDEPPEDILLPAGVSFDYFLEMAERTPGEEMTRLVAVMAEQGD